MLTRRGMPAGLLAIMITAAGSISACTENNASQPSPTAPTSAISTPPAPSTTGTQPCGPPALRITEPADGSRVQAPFPVSYEVRCFTIGQNGTIVFAADGMRFDLHPQAATGTVNVPDHPLLSGNRTVTFQLARPDGQSLSNPEAAVTRQLTITGRRSG